MKLRYLPPHTGYADLMEDFDLNEVEVDEQLLQKWTNDIVDEISTDEQLIHVIELLPVSNYKANKPKGLSMVNMAAYRLEKPDHCGTPREQINSWTQKMMDGCELNIEVNCPECHKPNCSCDSSRVIVDVDRIWELSNAHFNYSMDFARLHRFSDREYSTYWMNFRPLPYNGSDWFQAKKFLGKCVQNIPQKYGHSFSISSSNIEVTYEKGELLLDYLSKPMDADGNLLIPDDPQVFRAITDYLIYRLERKRFYKTRNGNDQRIYKDAQAEYERSLGVARSKLQLPDMHSWSAWLKNNRYYKVNNAMENLYQRGNSRMPQKGRNPNDPLYPTNKNLYRK